MSDNSSLSVGFIGSGRMATALAKGLIAAGRVAPERVSASDVFEPARQQFTEQTGVTAVDSNAAVVRASDVVVLAVKPLQMAAVLSDLSDDLTDSHLVITIAAGLPISAYESWLGANRRIIRVMPNTPCLIGETAAAFSTNAAATEDDAALVESLLSTVGIAVRVDEKLLDAVTGLSGSGPAYVYQIIEALSDGGVRVGLPRDIATRLAAQTVMGAAKMVLETGEHPGALKDAVTSPGGTTIAGLHALEHGGLRGTLMDAVVAATERSRELGQ